MNHFAPSHPKTALAQLLAPGESCVWILHTGATWLWAGASPIQLCPEMHLESSSSVMQPYFANQSCDPFTSPSTPCELGNYVSYAVNVSGAADIQATVNFARTNKVRLVVRNRGHETLNRSWRADHMDPTISTASTSSPWSDSYFTGTAMKIGAGVMGYQAAEAADAAGVVAVTGECPTVGLAGFTMGAGHSSLSSSFGLGADQVLSYDVVTTDGRLVTASPTENSDLYWALSGGGPGTYAVVVSMTVKTHPQALIGGASLQLSAAYTTQAKFDEALTALHALLPNMTDQGAHIIYTATNQLLQLNPVTIYNSTGEHIRDTVLAPFLTTLTTLGIPFATKYTTLPFLAHYDTYMGPLPNGNLAVSAYQFGSRLIPRTILQTPSTNTALQLTLQNLTAQGLILAGSAASYATPPNTPPNAVLPAWRTTAVQLQLITRWDSAPEAWPRMLADQEWITNEVVPQVEAVTPGGGTYVNEADFRQPRWREDFFGGNWERLSGVKKKWDAGGVLYALRRGDNEGRRVGGNGGSR
ncbi:hypothetical protein CHGG_06134 [Chaetomium globosum CBS 148.51]|uniref:FAD-binding PCMH-type domain-containing protein n=1 Tax=Chaetomium globosum (strain ATCC 6205 / CBS 148.51 / DSM 1962 / NBRC 6347 / NRRL 1970) TaxID=306901 RepID=Q2H5D1_CHAGB|nr:uncharacterized protein CHGG_06134 [Chaetomium globosum CBS 148.51]EAQ89515.1 hypothetical protein CHGG_06134 [Chaetomium globosum CBS 148.51]